MDDEELEASLAEMQALLDRGEPFAVVVQTHHNRMMSLHQIRRQAEHGKQTYDVAKRLVRGIAMVIPSAVIRGVLKVSFKLSPMPSPYALFDELPPAEAWAREKLGPALASAT